MMPQNMNDTVQFPTWTSGRGPFKRSPQLVQMEPTDLEGCRNRRGEAPERDIALDWKILWERQRQKFG
ncbi:hypothetical protein B1757_06875 [Acidithiobacillus marinus]|uniref:Uncharacterized protein n=1 Tax=Acidithiobacillus marinus TaxID=187490 RepID=A0A2I1DMC7_9PROT|nr:hypothetical protein B1757_06875 [Acidithiobacillus marinus]